MNFYCKLVTFFFAALSCCFGQIYADFETTEGDFTMVLDFQNSPLAVANFILLAGKGDDILETPGGVPLLDDPNHYRQAYYRIPAADSDVSRQALRVNFVPRPDPFQGFYDVFQDGLRLGRVWEFAQGGFHADITGEDRIRLQRIGMDPVKYRITLRYPRNWLDARDSRIKEAPMYRALRVNRVETGRRFYAGGRTADPFEHPGYLFQDEIFRRSSDYHGIPFNSAGVLAMDNTGRKNQNGCRFFVTSIAEPTYNGRYTAFGNVLTQQDLNVVRGIANTSTTGNQEPEAEMFILGITFRRFGLLANEFLEGYWRTFLPGLISEMPLSIDRSNGGIVLVSATRPQTQNTISTSTDLINYLPGNVDIQPPLRLDPLNPIQFIAWPKRADLSSTVEFLPKLFLKGHSAALPSWPSAAIDLDNARLSFAANSGEDRGNLNMDFNATGTGGTYAMNMIIEQIQDGESVFLTQQGTGMFNASYNSTKGPFVGVLTIAASTGPLNTDELTLHFDSSRFTNFPGFNPASLILRFDSRTTDPETPFLDYSGIFSKPF